MRSTVMNLWIYRDSPQPRLLLSSCYLMFVNDNNRIKQSNTICCFLARACHDPPALIIKSASLLNSLLACRESQLRDLTPREQTARFLAIFGG